MLIHPDVPNVLYPGGIYINQGIIGLGIGNNNGGPAQDAIGAILLAKISKRFVVNAEKVFHCLIKYIRDLLCHLNSFRKDPGGIVRGLCGSTIPRAVCVSYHRIGMKVKMGAFFTTVCDCIRPE